PNSEDRSPDLLLNLPDLSLDAGERAELSLQPTEAGTWAGLQAAFRFDPDLLEVEGLSSRALPDFSAEHWHMPQPGQLRLSWSADQAQPAPAAADWLTLRLRAKQPLRLSEAWHLDETALPAEAYTATAARRALHLAFRQMSGPGEAVSIGAPQPNPSAVGSHLWVHLPAAQTVLLSVYDLSGQQVHRFSADLGAGAHRLELPAAIFPQTGLYTWRVEAGETARTGRLLVAE
ncbi:MAG TPA: T9SS type A sorting domain-containing protein, partial [Saprospiraceae bacterium]|nr:T9SS type A sorting domain-containing protein [Saprospiraceae bacterium]